MVHPFGQWPGSKLEREEDRTAARQALAAKLARVRMLADTGTAAAALGPVLDPDHQVIAMEFAEETHVLDRMLASEDAALVLLPRKYVPLDDSGQHRAASVSSLSYALQAQRAAVERATHASDGELYDAPDKPDDCVAFCIVMRLPSSSAVAHKKDSCYYHIADAPCRTYEKGALYIARFHALPRYHHRTVQGTGRSVGHLLLGMVLDVALGEDNAAARRIVLDVDQRNPVRTFYQRHLFRDTGFVKHNGEYTQFEMVLDLGQTPQLLSDTSLGVGAALRRDTATLARFLYFQRTYRAVLRGETVSRLRAWCSERAATLLGTGGRLLVLPTAQEKTNSLHAALEQCATAPIVGLAVHNANGMHHVFVHPALPVGEHVLSIVKAAVRGGSGWDMHTHLLDHTAPYRSFRNIVLS
jgi:hypothetical protein